jgi:ADP-heptose:LPS heptosyltransferase
MNLLVFKLNRLGDNLVFLPALQALRQRNPSWRITLITTPEVAELYTGPLAADEVLLCDKASFDQAYRNPAKLALWFARVRGRAPDGCLVSYDQGSVAHLLAKYSGAAVRVGPNLPRPRLNRAFTDKVEIPADQSPAVWNWNMAAAVSSALKGAGEWSGLPPPPNLSHLLPAATAKPAGRVLIHSGASRELNQWSPTLFAQVAEMLSDEVDVVWVSHGNTGPPPRDIAVATPNSIASLATLISGSDMFLGNNSGPMHLANALGIPGVVVTGPSAAGWNPFWHKDRWNVLRHPSLPCSPCEKLTEKLERCVNLEKPMACLKYSTAEMVAAACRSLLARKK